MAENFIYILAFIGFYALACYLYESLKTPVQLMIHNLIEVFSGGNYDFIRRRYGDWVAITGSSDGIGLAYAKELAKRNLNIVLISRTESKLKAVAKEIEENYSVKTKIIVADFSKQIGIYEHIEKDDIPVRILINNAGQSTTVPGYMASFDAEELWNVINVNIGAVTQLSRYFIQRLRKSHQTGLIVNISSGSEILTLPYSAVYAATKAYMRSLTLALQCEAGQFVINFELFSPFFITTKINSYSKYMMRGGLTIPSADSFAESAVKRLGKVDQTSGYSWHGIQTCIVKALPPGITFLLMNYLGRSLLSKSQLKVV